MASLPTPLAHYTLARNYTNKGLCQQQRCRLCRASATISVFYTVETGCSRRFDRCKARCVWTSVCVWTRSVFSPGQLLEGQYSVWSVTHEKVRLEEGYAFTTGCRRGTILPQH